MYYSNYGVIPPALSSNFQTLDRLYVTCFFCLFIIIYVCYLYYLLVFWAYRTPNKWKKFLWQTALEMVTVDYNSSLNVCKVWNNLGGFIRRYRTPLEVIGLLHDRDMVGHFATIRVTSLWQIMLLEPHRKSYQLLGNRWSFRKPFK